MCAVTHRIKPYQLALLIKKSLDAESSIDSLHLKKCIFYIRRLKLQRVKQPAVLTLQTCKGPLNPFLALGET